MAKLYYGNSSCTIEGSNIRGVQIRFRGAIEIDDKTSDSFVIVQQKDGILVLPIGGGTINDLFYYKGEFKIVSVIVVDNDGQKIPTTIHRVMDYTELLNTNAEDMTTKSEDLSSTYISGRRVAKTTLKQPNLNNQHTSRYSTKLYLEDGTIWSGYFHIHLSDNAAMTGKEHTEDSQDLYYSAGKPTRHTGVPYGAIKQKKEIKAQKMKSRRRNKRRGNY